MVLRHSTILFYELIARRMKLSNEEPMLDLEEWDASEDQSFSESELQCFLFILWRSSMKTIEDEDIINFNGVKVYEEEGKWSCSVFKEGK